MILARALYEVLTAVEKAEEAKDWSTSRQRLRRRIITEKQSLELESSSKDKIVLNKN